MFQGDDEIPVTANLLPAAATHHLAPLTEAEKLALSLRIGSLVDEYDPGHPNVYDEIVKANKKLRAAKANQTVTKEVPVIEAAPTFTAPSPFAVRILRKMGWHDGSGLGREQQGISTPLVAENFSGHGVIMQAKPVSLLSRIPEIPKVVTPTRIVRLKNLLNPSDIDDTLEDEISDEAEKFGNLISVKVDVTDEVRVYCEYETVDDAKRALTHFDGRYFGGNLVTAEFA